MADHGSDRYLNTPRKIFEKHVDRMELRRQRDRADHRADLQALIKRVLNLEAQHTLLDDHVKQHCLTLNGDEVKLPAHGNEELD